MPYLALPGRALLQLSGDDARPFLQGLVTVNVEKISKSQAAYGLLLTPQGRYLHDFFILDYEGGLLLDTQAERADDLMKRLKLYKLKRKVELSKVELPVTVVIPALSGDLVQLQIPAQGGDDKVIADPRHPDMGFRVYGKMEPQGEAMDFATYERHRLQLGVVDSGRDMTVEKSLPLDFRMDVFNAVDFTKGCYVGQEVTARMHYKATPRRGIYKVKSTNGEALPQKGTAVTAGETGAGEMLSVQDDIGLALLKHEVAGQDLNASGLAITATVI